MRIVSLLPSATEIVHAIGAGQELVGRSQECDCPPGVRSLPIVMAARTLDGELPSRTIDERVRAAIGSGESLYRLDLDLLRSLRPDLLITQDLCAVCSVTEEEVLTACRVAGVDPRIVSLSPVRLEEVWASIETVGDAVGRPTEGRTVAAELRRRTTSGPVRVDAPRVAVVEWLDPPILAGLWTPDIIRAGGGIPLGPAAGEAGRRTTWKELSALGPDLVILSPCSFSVERTRRELETSFDAGRFRDLDPRHGVWLADEAYFSRPGPRLALGVELVRDLLTRAAPRAPLPVERYTAAPLAGVG